MKNKIWHKITISKEEQNIEIYPTETFNGIIVELKDLYNKIEPARIYLYENEMELLILKMQEMMKYILEKQIK